VPVGDVVDRRQLVSALLFGIIVSLLALALAPSLVWLDIASLTLGMMSAVAQVLVALAAQLSPPQHRGRIDWHHFGWPGTTALGLFYSCVAVLVRFTAWMPATAGVIKRA
jgi:MFS family permease